MSEDKMKQLTKKNHLGYKPKVSKKLNDLVNPVERLDGDKEKVSNEVPEPKEFKIGTILWPQEHAPKNIALSEGKKLILEEGFWDWLQGLWHQAINYLTGEGGGGEGGEYESDSLQSEDEYRKIYRRIMLAAKRIYHTGADYNVYDEELTDFVERLNSRDISKKEFIYLLKNKTIDRMLKRMREKTRRAILKQEQGQESQD